MAFLLPLLAITLFIHAHSALIEQTWSIDYKFVSPDGIEKAVPVINQQLPGPTLRGHVKDRVRIHLTNNLPSESTTIHWHGIKQLNTPWSDGVPGITQCAIAPGESFTYEFTLDAPGTLWYHSHSALQKTSLYGLIVVEGDSHIAHCKAPDIELLLSDWYHASSATQITGLRQRLPNKFRWVGSPQSLTIQGRAHCFKPPCDPTFAGPLIIDVEPSSTYRLRIVGASSLAHMNFGIDMHKFRVIEAETTPTRPLAVRYLDIGSSNSYSALLTTFSRADLNKLAPGHNGLFWVQANVRHRPSEPRGLAILRYSFAKNETIPNRKVPTDWPVRDDVEWSLAQARALKALKAVRVPPPDRRFVMLGTQNRHEDGSLVWSVNNISFTGQATPLIHTEKYNITSEKRHWREAKQIPRPFDYGKTLSEANLSIMARKAPHVIRVRKGEVIEIVLQNTLSLSGSEEIHPWVRSIFPNACIFSVTDHFA